MPKAKSKVSEAMEEGLQLEYEETESTNHKASSKKVFDFNKYKVSNSTSVETLSVDGTEFEVTLKPLTWSKKNQFLSKCMKWDSDGNTVFDGDAYVRLALQRNDCPCPLGQNHRIISNFH